MTDTCENKIGTVVPKSPLSKEEQSALKKHEKVIKKGLKTVLEVGAALIAIRDGKLYRKTHDTFEKYCEDRWGFSSRRAFQLVDATQALENLKCEPVVHNLPKTERAIRPLTELPKEGQIEAAKQAVTTAEKEGRKVTPKDIKKAVEEVKAKGRPQIQSCTMGSQSHLDAYSSPPKPFEADVNEPFESKKPAPVQSGFKTPVEVVKDLFVKNHDKFRGFQTVDDTLEFVEKVICYALEDY